MTPDKIKEGFESRRKEISAYLESPKTWSRDHGAEYCFAAGVEWMLSQASENFTDFRKSIGEEIFQCNQTASRLILEYDLMKREEAAFIVARLSSAKEIASLKDQILRYEHDNRELRAKSLNEIAEKDARVEQLEQGLDMSLLVSRQYREAIEESLNMSTRGKLSPNDAKILIKQVIEISQRKTKGLDETAPETYLKLKKEIAEKDAQIKQLNYQLDVFGGWLIEVNCPPSVLHKFRKARELASKKEST